MRFRFDRFRLDVGGGTLYGPLGHVPLPEKPFRLLCALVEAEGRVLSKETAIEAVWPGRIVSDASLATALKDLRHAIGDTGEAQRLIETVKGRGIRLAVPVFSSTAAALQGSIKASGEGICWLDRALQIDPNSAQATYARGVLFNLNGEPDAAQRDLATAIQSSPLDPRIYSMRGHLGVASILQGDFEKALEWAEHSVRSPRKEHMSMFAASVAASLAGENTRAQHWKSELARVAPQITPARFFESMPLPQLTQKQFTQAFDRIG